jgi:hypothetical protein
MLAEALGARGIALVEDGGFTYARKATRAQSAVSVYLYAPSTSDWGRGRPDFEIEVSPSHDRRQTFKPGKEGFNWQKIADKIERSLQADEGRKAELKAQGERREAVEKVLANVAKGLGLKPPISIWSTRAGGVAEATGDGTVEFSFRCPAEHIADVLGLLKRLGIAKLEEGPDDTAD